MTIFDLQDDFDLTGRRIALVGGAGFIGHNLAIQLAELGAKVDVIDGLQVNNLAFFLPRTERPGNRKLYMQLINERLHLMEQDNIDLHVQDARDYHALGKILNAIEPDTVVHLAAIAHANRANKDPYSTFDHSLRTLENALDWSRFNGAHFVYFSSSMVYGNFESDSVSEAAHCSPLGIYGALKYSGEKLLISYNQVFDLPYTIIRPSALYGERCVSRRVGQAFIENALEGKKLTINGDGEDRLDFTYIGDMVQGIVRTISNDKAKNEIFNITYGSARSINDLANIVKEYFPSLEIEHHPRDALMPERGTLQVDKARELIGYNPSYPVERGFREYVEWYLNFREENPKLFA